MHYSVEFCVSVSWHFSFYLNKIHPVSWVVLLHLISTQLSTVSRSPSHLFSLIRYLSYWKERLRFKHRDQKLGSSNVGKMLTSFRIVSYTCRKSDILKWIYLGCSATTDGQFGYCVLVRLTVEVPLWFGGVSSWWTPDRYLTVLTWLNSYMLELIRNTPQLLLVPFHASDGGKWMFLSFLPFWHETKHKTENT